MFGDFADGVLSEPKCKARVNGDCEPWLSADCSLKHLMDSAAAMEILNPWISQMIKKQQRQGGVKSFCHWWAG